MKPEFLNVDLEIITDVDPTPLAEALGERVSVLYCGKRHHDVSKRLMKTSAAFFVLFCILCGQISAADKPNIIVIYADDLGYGDLGCYGHPTIRTPNLDRMAAEGMRFTDFYSAAEVCTPSRAALLTGRYPVRSGMAHDQFRVLRSRSTGHLPADEITIAEAFKARGYATGMIGKWHLGVWSIDPAGHPRRHGFDSYFGLPHSNDMDPMPGNPPRAGTLADQKAEWWNGPLYRNEEIIERPVDRNTLVCFSSDNGPWLTMNQQGGSAGLLRDGKGSTWEGGLRVPGIAWWPGKIKGGSVQSGLASTMDLFTTSLRLGRAELPRDRVLDGLDLTDTLLRGAPSPRRTMFFYRGARLFAARKGEWKLHLFSQKGYGQPKPDAHEPPLLFNLEVDPGETFNVATNHPTVVADLLREIETHHATMTPVKSQLEDVLVAPDPAVNNWPVKL